MVRKQQLSGAGIESRDRLIVIIGRAGASPPSRTAAIIFLIYLFIYIRVVRRALNLLRASFSPIFQYFSAVNVTRLYFSLTCMPYMAPCAMDSLAMEGAVHSHSDFRVRRSVVHRALNWLVTHNQYCRSNHVHIDVSGQRQNQVTIGDYFKHLMMYDDNRFAKHPRFRFFALNTEMRWRALQTGRVYVKQHPGDAQLSLDELRDMVGREGQTFSNRVSTVSESTKTFLTVICCSQKLACTSV